MNKYEEEIIWNKSVEKPPKLELELGRVVIFGKWKAVSLGRHINADTQITCFMPCPLITRQPSPVTFKHILSLSNSQTHHNRDSHSKYQNNIWNLKIEKDPTPTSQSPGKYSTHHPLHSATCSFPTSPAFPTRVRPV